MRLFRGILEEVTGIDGEVRSRFERDDICVRCGICCHSSIRVKDRQILLLDLPCKYLSYHSDGKAICRVYHHRELTGWCHKISVESIRKELYPPECPYVRGLPHYGGKIRLSDEEFESVKPILRKIFEGWPKPDHVYPSVWRLFLHNIGL